MEDFAVLLILWLAIGAVGCGWVTRWVYAMAGREEDEGAFPLAYLVFIALGPIGVALWFVVAMFAALSSEEYGYYEY